MVIASQQGPRNTCFGMERRALLPPILVSAFAISDGSVFHR